MTAVLLSPLTGQFFDNNGNPLNGGLIYSYVAGTAFGTPLATYTNATGSTPAANPVVLNSAGRADIWGAGTYDFKITDSAGNILDTIMSVTAIFGTGDMTKAVYDPANIAQQLVGTTAVQTLTNKTLTSPTIAGATITSPTITSPTIDNLIVTGTAIFSGINKTGAPISFTSTTTFADITGMSFALNPGNYYIRTSGFVAQAAAGGFKLQSIFSGTAPAYSVVPKVYNGTALVTGPIGTSLSASFVNSTTGTSNYYDVDHFLNVSVAGTFKLQGAQQASNGTSTTFTSVMGTVTSLS